MRTRIFALLFAVLCAVGMFSGCHGSRGLEPFEIPESFDTAQQHQITFWAKNDTNKSQTAIYQKAIADFEALYPNVKVNMRLYTNYGDIYNDVITNISTGTTPNVCITYPDHIATYLTGTNVVVPLEGLFDDPSYGLGGSEVKFDSVRRDEVIPKFLDECAFDDHYYAMPFMRSTEACYVNRTYVEALGYELPEALTWDFIWEVSEAAMQKDADDNFVVNGQKVLIPFIYKSTDNMMIQMLRQRGAGYADSEGNIGIFNDVTTEILCEIAKHATTRSFSTFKISSYPANFMNAGQCIFAIDSTAGATWMGSDAPLIDISEDSLVDFETEVMTIPQFDVNAPKMISQGPSICVFNKSDSQEVLASWLFAQYLLTNDVQIAYAETEGYIPVTSAAQQSDEYVDYLSRAGEDNNEHYDVKIKASKLLLDNTQNTFVTPVFNGSASLRDAAGQLIENTTRACRRGDTVDGAYFETMYGEVASLYRLGQGGASTAQRTELGALPTESVVLLVTLAAVWAVILIYAILQRVKTRKNG